MNIVGSWKFVKKAIAGHQRRDVKNQLAVMSIAPTNNVCFDKMRRNDIVLVCGDGGSLLKDIKAFESFQVDHDVYCINRSMLAFERPIDHWAAIDAEESMWFSQNFKSKHRRPGQKVYRHTIGVCPLGYDVFWHVDQEFDNELQKHIWSGNSGYFGILSAAAMGYRKIILAGMPLDTSPHWYESKDKPGPNWVGQTYRTWIDFKRNHPEAEKVRSMSGYSEFILGKADKTWLLKSKPMAA